MHFELLLKLETVNNDMKISENRKAKLDVYWLNIIDKSGKQKRIIHPSD